MPSASAPLRTFYEEPPVVLLGVEIMVQALPSKCAAPVESIALSLLLPTIQISSEATGAIARGASKSVGLGTMLQELPQEDAAAGGANTDASAPQARSTAVAIETTNRTIFLIVLPHRSRAEATPHPSYVTPAS